MRCRTHIMASNALMLLLTNPKTEKELLVSIGTATIGGIISDLDIRTSDTHKLIDFITITTLIGLLVLYIIDCNYLLNIFTTIKNGPFYLPIIGLLIMLGLIHYGSHQPHRSFLHSILGTFLLTITVYFFFGNVWRIFLMGMISHISLDILNKKGLRLFYPAKETICLNICEFGGIVDKIIFYSCIIICILKLFIL